MFKNAQIGDTVYFWFAANTVAGSQGDGAAPLYVVRLAGADVGAAKTASGTPTLLTHADYYDGIHEIAIDTTGWAAGEYAVFCSLTISAVNPSGFCGSFNLRAAGTVSSDNTGLSTFNSATDQVVASNMRGTDNAALATVCTETRLAQLEAANLPANIADILVDTGTTLDGKINAIKLKTDTLGGAGSISYPFIVTQTGGAAVDGAQVWVSTDSQGIDIIANGITDVNGLYTFHLDAGGYWFWAQHSGLNPASVYEVVS